MEVFSLTLSKRGKHIQITQENTCDPSLEIDPERLFERFYRGDSARTQSAEFSGYGIGLSAARAICEKFNGKMTAEYASAESHPVYCQFLEFNLTIVNLLAFVFFEKVFLM